MKNPVAAGEVSKATKAPKEEEMKNPVAAGEASTATKATKTEEKNNLVAGEKESGEKESPKKQLPDNKKRQAIQLVSSVARIGIEPVILP